MNAISMNNLWNYLQGLSLSASNQRWLAERLLENAEKIDDECVMTDEEIRAGIAVSFQQLKEVREGKRTTRKVEELLNELCCCLGANSRNARNIIRGITHQSL